MSRNQKRITANQPQVSNPLQSSAAAEESPNPFGLSFVVNKEIVKLPSKGNFYSENSPLRGVGSLEIKAMTAKEEDIVLNESYIENGTVFDRLIDSIVTTPNIFAKDMQDCDKMAVLLHARKTGYGDDIELAASCNECGHEFEPTVSIGDILSKSSTSSTGREEWNIEESSGLVSVQLPLTKIDVKIRILTPEDKENLRNTIEKKKKLNLEYSETIEFLRKILVSANGVVDPLMLNQLCEVVPASDARIMTKAHKDCSPSVNMVADITCPSCNAVSAREVPFSLGWFWSK